MVGLSAGNRAETIIWRAMVLMCAAWVIGRLVGALAQHTIEEHIETHRQRHPIEEDVTDETQADEPQDQAPAAEQAVQT